MCRMIIVFLHYHVQINLYQNLLRKKHGELIGNMERLEGGLEKLKSTAAQVSRRLPHIVLTLNPKLALQY